MNPKHIDFYTSEILKAGAGKEIKAVVLDVRYNGGGSDRVWQKILAKLVKGKISVENQLAIPDSPETREYTKRNRQVLSKYFPELEQNSSDEIPVYEQAGK